MTIDWTSLLEATNNQRGRTRADWNARFEHWERPASDSEEQKIQRAAGMVRTALSGSAWLAAQGVSVHPQGSYYNNTNTRLDADMDLRLVHPNLLVEYADNVVREYADATLGYTAAGPSFGDLNRWMRQEVVAQLSDVFGPHNVVPGNKAIRLKGLPGSRAEVDVVPAFRRHFVWWSDPLQRYIISESVAILPVQGAGFTINFPDQHYANGVAKRGRTKQRFKKNVRILKRLRNELVDLGRLPAGTAPSFLIESLVYGVEDVFFLQDGDDRYMRVLRLLDRMAAQLSDANWPATATEINAIKPLFALSQPWTRERAVAFVVAARARLTQ